VDVPPHGPHHWLINNEHITRLIGLETPYNWLVFVVVQRSCAASRAGSSLFLWTYCGYHRWWSPSSRCGGGGSGPQGVWPCGATPAWCHQWGTPGPNGSVWPPGGRVRHSSAAGPCGCHGWFASCSRCLGAPMAPKGHAHMALHLLGATSGAQQGQMAVSGLLGLVSTLEGGASLAFFSQQKETICVA